MKMMPGAGRDHLREDKQQIDNAPCVSSTCATLSQTDRFSPTFSAYSNSADLSQRINTARLLSGANSPLRRLVQNPEPVRRCRATRSSARGRGKAQDQSNRATRTLEALFSNDNAPTQGAVVTQAPEQPVTDHYAPMIEHASAAGEGRQDHRL